MNTAKYAEAEEDLSQLFQHLSDHAFGLQTTVILMPLPGRNAKRSSSPYGLYEVPSKPLQARRYPSEEPLSEPAAAKGSSSSSQLPKHSPSQSSKPVPTLAGIIPVCHSNKEACEAATNNCTGRGTCYLKYTSTGGDAKSSKCYACGCKATVRENPSGSRKTTEWGGSACQKKDVSMPFLLIAGFTIAIVGVVSWGIGLLFSIGQETLPSVIGAGVAGPRAQK